MEGLLQHQNSTVSFAKNHGSCMWNWLQIFDQRLHSQKLLQDTHHEDIKATRSYVPLTESEANFLIFHRDNARKRRSGNTLIKALLSKFRKHNRKQRKLLRTVSIHHLESNDYVQDEGTSDNNFPKDDFSSQETDSSAGSEKVPLCYEGEMCEICKAMNMVNHVRHNHLDELENHITEKAKMLAGKLHEAQDSWKQKESVASKLGRVSTLQSEDFLSMIELLNAHREFLVKTTEDPNVVKEDLFKDHHTSRVDRALTRSGSFPVVVSSGKRNAETSKHKDRWDASNSSINQKVKSFKSSMMADIIDSDSSDVGNKNTGSTSLVSVASHELRHQTEDRTPLDHSGNPTPRMIDDKNEYRRGHRRISMDAVLHRIPYGHKVSEGVKATKLFRSASARSYRDDQKSQIGVPSKGYLYHTMERSRSLTESLDRYSRIIESIPTMDSRKLPENMILSQEHNSLQEGITVKSFGRIYSNPEILSNPSGRGNQNAAFHGALSPKASYCSSINEDEVLDIHDKMDAKSVNPLEDIKGSMEETTDAQTMVADDGGTFDGGLKWLENEPKQNSISTSDTAKECISNIPVGHQETGGKEQIKHHQNEISEISDLAQVASSLIDEKETEVAVNLSNELIKQNPTAVHDTKFDADSELEPRIHSELDLSSANQQDHMGVDVSEGLKFSKSNIVAGKLKNLAGADAFLVRVDYKDEAEFNYVRNVLRKSRFGDLELLDTLYSPLLHGEWVAPSDDVDVESYDSEDIALDRQVLLDLINEVLVEIYQSFFARSWFSRFDSRLRLSLAANRLLEEVWTKISSQLSLQGQQSFTLENVIARDLSKNDGWLNLQLDAQYIGMELEDLILDNLLHELIFEL